MIYKCVSGKQQIQPAHTARACAGAMTDNPERPERKREVSARLRGSLGAAQTGRAVAAKAAGFPGAVAAHDASTRLTEWDETMAVETQGVAEASTETLCNVLGLDS